MELKGKNFCKIIGQVIIVCGIILAIIWSYKGGKEIKYAYNYYESVEIRNWSETMRIFFSVLAAFIVEASVFFALYYLACNQELLAKKISELDTKNKTVVSTNTNISNAKSDLLNSKDSSLVWKCPMCFKTNSKSIEICTCGYQR